MKMAKLRKNKTNANSEKNVNTGEIVLSAIKKLMKNTGWTARTIVKFIKMEYGLNYPNLNRKVSRALKRGVRLGLLQMERGRYRLNDMSRLVRPVETSEIRQRHRYRERERQKPRERPLRLRSPANSVRTTRNRRHRK